MRHLLLALVEASKMGLSFAEGFEPWLNDLYPCRMPIFNNLHFLVGSNVNEWEATKQETGNRYS